MTSRARKDPTPVDEADPQKDGRVRRGNRNRELILDALHTLMKEGTLHPTAPQVARQAGLGERSVYRHFTDMERLHADLGRRMEREIQEIFRAPSTSKGSSLRERVHELVEQRARLYEYLAPFRRSASRFRFRSPFIQQGHDRMARALRAQIEVALAPEIGCIEADLVEAVDTLAAFETWDRLRLQRKLSTKQAASVVESAILTLLGR